MLNMILTAPKFSANILAYTNTQLVNKHENCENKAKFNIRLLEV